MDGFGLTDTYGGAVSTLEKDLQKTRGQFEAANKDAEKATDTANAAQGEVIKEAKDYRSKVSAMQETIPHPHIEEWKEKPPEANPIQAFGSWASAFGLLAGLLTKTPLSSSLNASAAAMSAIRANDLHRYEDAKEAWRENTRVAIQNAQWESARYKEGMDLLTTDHQAASEIITATATQAKNQFALAQFRAGNYEKFFEMTKGMADYAAQAPARAWDMMVTGAKNAYVIAAQNDYKAKNPNATKDELSKATMDALTKVQRDFQLTTGTRQMDDAKAQAAFDLANNLDAEWAKKHPDATPEEKAMSHAQNLKLAAEQSGLSKVATGGSLRTARQVELADARNGELQETNKITDQAEREAKVDEINEKYDQQVRSLYAPKDAPGAAAFTKDIARIDDLDPILEAMEALISAEPETIGLVARRNRYVADIKGQLGADIGDKALLAEQVKQLASMALGPMSQIYGGTGQWTSRREALMRAIDDPTELFAYQEKELQDIETLRGGIREIRKKREDLLKRRISPAPNEKSPITRKAASADDFKSDTDVKSAFSRGEITQDEALKILKDKFGYTD